MEDTSPQDEKGESETAATRDVLLETLNPAEWNVSPAEHGRGTGVYVARSRHGNVFVKWDVRGDVLSRLSDLGIVPPLLAAGYHEGRPYTIQQFVPGTHPDRMWFGAHMAEVAGLVRTYQDDEELARVLSFGDEWRQKDSVRDAVTEIFQGLDRALPPVFRSATVMESVTRWQAEAQDIASAPLRPVHVSTRSSSVLAPVHCDPNSKNFLLSHDRVYLVDWDEATLSDPMRDIGPLLWWYLPRLQWSEFLGHYGTEMSSEMEGRVYWWAAHRSISVALWIAQHSMESARIDDFLTDFVAAASGADNPKGRLP